jgi:Popeye protein conserved region
MGIDLFIHAANILLLLTYSVTDILWLRLLAVASSLAAMPYFLLQPTPLWAAFGWSVLFAGIKIFQTWRLLVERRPIKLTAEEQEVGTLVFQDLPPKKVLQVIGVGTWASAASGMQQCTNPIGNSPKSRARTGWLLIPGFRPAFLQVKPCS